MPPTQNQPVFFAPLEAFCGFAALFVAWFHSSIVNIDKPLLIRPGNIYVDFFFVLSGFVIMHAYAAKIGKGMTFYEFAVLRLARIWPLHIFMLMVFLMYNGVQWIAAAQLGVGDGPGGRNTLYSFVCNVLLVHSLGFLNGLSWNYPSWSISVEYYTYLIFFGVVWAFFSRRYLVSVILSVLAFGAMFWISFVTGKPSILASYDYGIIRCIASFFAGTALYGLYLRVPLTFSYLAMSLLEFGALALSLAIVVQSNDNGTFQFATILSFVLLIYVFSSGKGIFSQLLSLPPFRFLGRISFSIYMTHAIFMIMAGIIFRKIFHLSSFISETGGRAIQTEYAILINIIILSIVVLASSITYVYIERRGQDLIKRTLIG